MRNGFISTECIKQVFIDAIGLLCETHGSTEIVSVEEMQLFQFFMMYNLNSQSPSVRQQKMRRWEQSTQHDFRGGRWKKVVEVQREQEKAGHKRDGEQKIWFSNGVRRICSVLYCM